MVTQGRNRAYHAAATADGQPAAPQALRATLLLAAVLNLAMVSSILADDGTQPPANHQARSSKSESNGSGSVSGPTLASPGIRQPQYALPSGVEVSEPARIKTPAAASQSQAAQPTQVAAASDAAKAVEEDPSFWTSPWRRLFAKSKAKEEKPKPKPVRKASSSDLKARPPAAPHTSPYGDDADTSLALTQSAEAAAQEAAPSESTDSAFSKIKQVVTGQEGPGKVVIALGQQVSTMRSDEVMPSEPAVRTEAALTAPAPAESRNWDDSPLLQPFKATNYGFARTATESSWSYGGSGNGLDSVDSMRLNFLTSQFGMSRNDNWRSLAEAAEEESMLTDEAYEERGWSYHDLPTMSNPFTVVENSAWVVQAPAGGAQLAAYQETLPAPPSQDGDDVFRDDPGQNGNNSQQRGANEPKTLADSEKVGEEPEDNTLQFLRTQTVLLEPGESQFDVGINYLISENRFPILLLNSGVPIGTDNVLFRIRELTIPFEYRVGLLKRVQGFIGAPVGWSNTQVAIGDYEQYQNDGGFGDVDFGTTIQVIDGNAECPHGLFTISATAPSGGDPFGPTALLAQSAPSLGQGFWSISANALCVQTYDPIVLFYGIGAEHFFSREFNGREFDPGNYYNYSFGVGFAVNDRVTLSTRFLGSYVEETRVNRERIFGTNIEPMSIRMAATISKPCNRIVEPFVEFGITDSAIDSYFGITWTY